MELTDNNWDEMELISISMVNVRPQVRKHFDAVRIDEMAASLKEVGQQQPILVLAKDKTYDLIYGECRLRAAQQLGWTTINAIVTIKELTESEILQRQLIENLQRVELCPIETAMGMQRLMQMDGLKAGAVATRLGKTAGCVSKLLGLLKLPEAIQQQVASGQIAASSAYGLSRVDDGQVRDQLADDLVSGRINRDGLARAIKTRTKKPQAEKTAVTSRATAALVGGKSLTVVAPALNMESFIDLLEEVLEEARKEHKKRTQLGTFIQLLRDRAMQPVLAEFVKT